MTQESVFAGIDVANDRLDLALRPSGTVRTVAYDAAGVRALVSELQSLEPSAVSLTVVVNPCQVRDFAKATGRLAKTDVLDAQMLAHFAEAVRPAVRPLLDSDAHEPHSLNARAHPGGGNAGGGEESAGPGRRLRSSPHPGPYRVSGAGAERPAGGCGICFAAARCGWSRTTCRAPFPE